MDFHSYPYVRPNFEKVKSDLTEILLELERHNEQTFKGTAETFNRLRSELDTLSSLCYIRHTINTEDVFYENEQEFWDEHSPLLQEYITKFYRLILDAPFRHELEKEWGTQLFKLAESELRTFSPHVVEDLQKENRVSSQYTKLLASAKIPFQGEERTLSQMTPFTENENRSIRKEATKAVSAFFVQNKQKFDRLFDELVQIRTTIAQKLGYKNFVELGYARMYRTDYNHEDVAVFRKQVREKIVPVITSLKELQKERLGLDTLYFYDESVKFASGNPIPKGDVQWIVKQAEEMYDELSAETAEWMDFMVHNHLLDLESKKGKASGGYCSYMDNYKAPFIFANFNGTSGDVDVLTHEAGHAFQVYSSRDIDIPEYHWPTYEACEVHSMSMEFFTWPWMKAFFKEDADKYYFMHLTGALTFIPYGVLVDEFQHHIYENPDLTAEQRDELWNTLEKVYLPHRQYGEDEFLAKGGFWYRQRHIFESPFYYIDYTLAQICAFQYWKWMREDRQNAWNSYIALCKRGGSASFVELIEEAGLLSPFDEGSVDGVVREIQQWIQQFPTEHLK